MEGQRKGQSVSKCVWKIDATLPLNWNLFYVFSGLQRVGSWLSKVICNLRAFLGVYPRGNLEGPCLEGLFTSPQLYAKGGSSDRFGALDLCRNTACKMGTILHYPRVSSGVDECLIKLGSSSIIVIVCHGGSPRFEYIIIAKHTRRTGPSNNSFISSSGGIAQCMQRSTTTADSTTAPAKPQ